MAPDGEWWEVGEDRCPKCGKPTERRLCKGLEEGREDTTYMIGERCQPCGWEIDLSED